MLTVKQSKCVIRDKDGFATKQCMLGVEKIKQLKRVIRDKAAYVGGQENQTIIIRDKADFATKQRMLEVKIFVQN